jgi:arsenite methyltransferase
MTEDESSTSSDDLLRDQVRERYGRIASGGSCCSADSGASSGCDGDPGAYTAGGLDRETGCCGGSEALLQLGYSAEEISTLPEGANLGLGCGNPTALAALRAGQVVLDLGSGAGIDCFLAAKRVGENGRVIGVDMTPEMVAKARANAVKGNYRNVEFRLGEIEHLPVADSSVDVVVSNCVINLVPDKGRVYREIFRVLRPGGWLAVSDVLATRPISEKDRQDPAQWSSCSSGALEVGTVRKLLLEAGFDRIDLKLRQGEGVPDSLAAQDSLGVVPADVRAVKPR